MANNRYSAPPVQGENDSWITRGGSRLNRILETQDELLRVARRAFLRKRAERNQPRLAAFTPN